VREESIGILTKQSSYSLKNIVVREFASKKFLSIGKEGSQIVGIEDIGDVVEDTQTHKPSTVTLAAHAH